MTIIRCIDAESTGLDPSEAGILELGWCDVTNHAGVWEHEDRYTSSLVALPNGMTKIPPESSAIHHIVTADLVGAPHVGEVIDRMMDGADHFAAHNFKFEDSFLRIGKGLCTYKVGVVMAPNAPAHNLQTLRYYLGLKLRPDLARDPHRAGPDSYICAALLTRMLNKGTVSLEQMLEISGNPVLLPRMTFGKNVGKPFSEIEGDYLSWILKQADMDADVVHSAFIELQRRRETSDDAVR